EKAIDNGYKPATAMYNIACTYAIHDDKENALRWLAKAVDEGFDQGDTIESDDDLDSLRADVRFQRIVERVTGDKADGRLSEIDRRYEALKSARLATTDEWKSLGNELLKLRDLD